MLVEANSKGGFINRHVAYQFVYQKVVWGDFSNRGHGFDNELTHRFVTGP